MIKRQRTSQLKQAATLSGAISTRIVLKRKYGYDVVDTNRAKHLRTGENERMELDNEKAKAPGDMLD